MRSDRGPFVDRARSVEATVFYIGSYVTIT